MHFELGIQGRSLENSLQGRGDNSCSSLVKLWKNWGWASHRFRRAPAGVCMGGWGCGEMLDMAVSAEGNGCSQTSPPNQP